MASWRQSLLLIWFRANNIWLFTAKCAILKNKDPVIQHCVYDGSRQSASGLWSWAEAWCLRNAILLQESSGGRLHPVEPRWTAQFGRWNPQSLHHSTAAGRQTRDLAVRGLVGDRPVSCWTAPPLRDMGNRFIKVLGLETGGGL